MKSWQIVSDLLKRLFDKEYSAFEMLAFMSLVTLTDNFFALLGFGLLIVIFSGFMRGFSDALAEKLSSMRS